MQEFNHTQKQQDIVFILNSIHNRHLKRKSALATGKQEFSDSSGYENPYKNKLNKYAIDRIKEVTGANPIVNVGSNGEYTDENGNYWMAVGPKVPNPSQASNANISAEQVYALGKLDVVVKSSNGTLYYIPGVIGDIKAHTWNNGVIQTYKAYPDGKFASAGRNFNGTVCAEFIGDLDGKLTGLGSYSVEKIIFYAD